MRILLYIALLILPIPAMVGTAPAIGDEDLARRLDQYLQSQVPLGFSGAVLVARGPKVVLSKGYGYANVEWNIPNTPQTRFRIASLTKSFTATAIMQLREKGKLTLTDSICKYFDPCPQAWRAVTIHHLLTNSSGIPNHFWGTESDRQVAMSQEQILARISAQPLEFAPGTRFNYGNSGWYLLGMIMERIAHKPYEEVLHEQIFEPLGMKDTGQDNAVPIVERRASGYLSVDGKISNVLNTDVSWVIGAASLFSTVADLFKFDQALYGTSLLPQAALDLMWTAVDVPWSGASHQKAQYGYGWWLRPKEDPSPRKFIRGMGGMDGFLSTLLRMPQDRVTIDILQNSIGPPPMEPKLVSIVFQGDR